MCGLVGLLVLYSNDEIRAETQRTWAPGPLVRLFISQLFAWLNALNELSRVYAADGAARSAQTARRNYSCAAANGPHAVYGEAEPGEQRVSPRRYSVP